MKIHEYQAKEIFRRFGVPTPRGQMVTSPEQAFEVAKSLGTPVVVVKAQIHAGGRGKAGGVKLARSPEQAKELAAKILGMNLVTAKKGSTSSANSISACSSIARSKLPSSWPAPRAAWKSKKWPRKIRKPSCAK